MSIVTSKISVICVWSVARHNRCCVDVCFLQDHEQIDPVGRILPKWYEMSIERDWQYTSRKSNQNDHGNVHRQFNNYGK